MLLKIALGGPCSRHHVVVGRLCVAILDGNSGEQADWGVLSAQVRPYAIAIVAAQSLGNHTVGEIRDSSLQPKVSLPANRGPWLIQSALPKAAVGSSLPMCFKSV